MAYRTGPHQLYVELPVPPRPILRSAVKIDAQQRDYVLDTVTGGFEGMPATAQRVLLLVAFAKREGEFITDQGLEQDRRNIEQALEPLTGGPSPAIKLLTIKAASEAPGTVNGLVSWHDNTTGLDQSVQV